MTYTKKHKVEHFDHVANERDLYMCAFHDVMNGDVVWSDWILPADRSMGDRYKVGWAGRDRGCGGAMIVQYRNTRTGQQDSWTVYEWHEAERRFLENGLGEWCEMIRRGCGDVRGKLMAKEVAA